MGVVAGKGYLSKLGGDDSGGDTFLERSEGLLNLLALICALFTLLVVVIPVLILRFFR